MKKPKMRPCDARIEESKDRVVIVVKTHDDARYANSPYALPRVLGVKSFYNYEEENPKTYSFKFVFKKGLFGFGERRAYRFKNKMTTQTYELAKKSENFSSKLLQPKKVYMGDEVYDNSCSVYAVFDGFFDSLNDFPKPTGHGFKLSMDQDDENQETTVGYVFRKTLWSSTSFEMRANRFFHAMEDFKAGKFDLRPDYVSPVMGIETRWGWGSFFEVSYDADCPGFLISHCPRGQIRKTSSSSFSYYFFFPRFMNPYKTASKYREPLMFLFDQRRLEEDQRERGC